MIDEMPTEYRAPPTPMGGWPSLNQLQDQPELHVLVSCTGTMLVPRYVSDNGRYALFQNNCECYITSDEFTFFCCTYSSARMRYSQDELVPQAMFVRIVHLTNHYSCRY